MCCLAGVINDDDDNGGECPGMQKKEGGNVRGQCPREMSVSVAYTLFEEGLDKLGEIRYPN